MHDHGQQPTHPKQEKEAQSRQYRQYRGQPEDEGDDDRLLGRFGQLERERRFELDLLLDLLPVDLVDVVHADACEPDGLEDEQQPVRSYRPGACSTGWPRHDPAWSIFMEQ